jgi:hypothetical protein
MICRLVEKSARLSGPFVLFTSPYRLGRDFASVGRVSDLGSDPVGPASDLDFDFAGRLGSDC